MKLFYCWFIGKWFWGVNYNNFFLGANFYYKKNLLSESKTKNSERHVGWADDNKNENNEKKLVNYDIENDLYFKKKVKGTF